MSTWPVLFLQWQNCLYSCSIRRQSNREAELLPFLGRFTQSITNKITRPSDVFPHLYRDMGKSSASLFLSTSFIKFPIKACSLHRTLWHCKLCPNAPSSNGDRRWVQQIFPAWQSYSLDTSIATVFSTGRDRPEKGIGRELSFKIKFLLGKGATFLWVSLSDHYFPPETAIQSTWGHSESNI